MAQKARSPKIGGHGALAEIKRTAPKTKAPVANSTLGPKVPERLTRPVADAVRRVWGASGKCRIGTEVWDV